MKKEILSRKILDRLDEFPEELTNEDLVKLHNYINKIINNARELRYRPNPWQRCDI